jgi:2-polyprenyl-3-methyl-5-hydroxy-6-metoxy-1,4-benzoquinol methylase
MGRGGRMVGEPRGQELIARYKRNYSISSHTLISERMILQHWELEKSLRKELLESNSDNRWATFERCYSKLYGELEWLNRLGESEAEEPPAVLYRNWLEIIGFTPKRIYEVGSGKGALITYLARSGHECKATEITQERGQRWASEHPNLSWGISDGIHLDRFEPKGGYDVVISNQVVEHMHPDDLLAHLRGVFFVLREGGIYMLATPHAHVGPADVSRIFKRDTTMGMHLKEYTYSEMKGYLKRAGFKDIYAVLRLPVKYHKVTNNPMGPKLSKKYLAYLQFVERLVAVLPSQKSRRRVSQYLQLVLFPSNLMVVARK